MKEKKNGKEAETREIVITKHFGKPEYPSYVQVNQLELMSAAELYFSSEPAGRLVYRVCDWLAEFTANKLPEMLGSFEEEEIGMMLHIMKKEPPIMSIGFLRGMLASSFNEDAACMLDLLGLCEAADDRVFDCFMAQFWFHTKESDQMKHFFEQPSDQKGVK